jgi:hypothetical protein
MYVLALQSLFDELDKIIWFLALSNKLEKNLRTWWAESADSAQSFRSILRIFRKSKEFSSALPS